MRIALWNCETAHRTSLRLPRCPPPSMWPETAGVRPCGSVLQQAQNDGAKPRGLVEQSGSWTASRQRSWEGGGRQPTMYWWGATHFLRVATLHVSSGPPLVCDVRADCGSHSDRHCRSGPQSCYRWRTHGGKLLVNREREMPQGPNATEEWYSGALAHGWFEARSIATAATDSSPS